MTRDRHAWLIMIASGGRAVAVALCPMRPVHRGRRAEPISASKHTIIKTKTQNARESPDARLWDRADLALRLEHLLVEALRRLQLLERACRGARNVKPAAHDGAPRGLCGQSLGTPRRQRAHPAAEKRERARRRLQPAVMRADPAPRERGSRTASRGRRWASPCPLSALCAQSAARGGAPCARGASPPAATRPARPQQLQQTAHAMNARLRAACGLVVCQLCVGTFRRGGLHQQPPLELAAAGGAHACSAIHRAAATAGDAPLWQLQVSASAASKSGSAKQPRGAISMTRCVAPPAGLAHSVVVARGETVARFHYAGGAARVG